MASRTFEIVSSVKPGKRARLVWQWWRPGRVVLVLEERGERGWRPLHRKLLREQHWGRAFEFAATWMGIEYNEQMTIRHIAATSGVLPANAPNTD